jgi:hypothetical protein
VFGEEPAVAETGGFVIETEGEWAVLIGYELVEGLAPSVRRLLAKQEKPFDDLQARSVATSLVQHE